MSAGEQSVQAGLVGNAAGWALSFHREFGGARGVDHGDVLTLTSDDCSATIDATLASGLQGGAYSFVLEGLTDDQYAKIAQGRNGSPTVVRLHLFWQDVNATWRALATTYATLGGVSQQTALDELRVAELAITGVSRRAGRLRYETTIEAVERVYHRLDELTVAEALVEQDALEVVRKVADSAGVDVVVYRGGPRPKVTVAPGLSGVQGVQLALSAVDEAMNVHGRQLVLIRNGVMHTGPRPVPMPRRAEFPLEIDNGLVEVTTVGGPKKRFVLTLKGRPDLKPGHVVSFTPPAGDAPTAVPGAVRVYVESVRHRLGRQSGFTTLLSGRTFTDPKDVWKMTPAEPTRAPDNGMQAVSAIGDLARRVAGQLRPPEVAEVRKAAVRDDAESGAVAQTTESWRGLGEPDGGSGGARRLAVRRPPDQKPAPLRGIPYATPFAWGRCGLVLPRYPGTRTLLVHRDGRADDPVDAGALWGPDERPQSEAGDWWLVLPAGVPDADRSSAQGDAAPKPWTGIVTNDLIDADGRRVIEAGELTVRVGRQSLRNAGERPPAPDPDKAVSIEHADAKTRILMAHDGKVTVTGKGGASIMLSPEGRVVIKTDEAVEVQAGGELSLKGGSVALEATQGDVKITGVNVKVQVTGTMDVS
jgi:hypothetical protein